MITGGTHYVHDDGGHLLGEYDVGGAFLKEYLWLGDTPVGVVSPGAVAGSIEVSQVHSDHLDTPRAVVSAGGVVRWRWDGEPFGATAANADADGDGTPYGFNLRFAGQYFDQETNLHYNTFRDYDPATGRYVQADPIGLAGGSMSLYTYADNAPTMRTDPLGLQAIPMPPPPVPGFPLPGSRPKPNDPSNLLDPPSSKAPWFSWPSWLTPKSAAERCEEDCEKQYDRDMDECRAYVAMTRDKYTFVACKQQAERRLSQCMSDCGKNCK